MSTQTKPKRKSKAFTVTNGDFGTVVFAQTASQARSIAAGEWSCYPEFIYLRARRIKAGDQYAKESKIGIADTDVLLELGFTLMCPDCNKPLKKNESECSRCDHG